MAEFWVTKSSQRAWCDDCGEVIGGERNGLGCAAQHHRKTGHTVRVEVERVVVYETQARQDKWRAEMKEKRR